jgi:copper chaperone CopZ
LIEEKSPMEKLILDLPAMYADHHVLHVRQALLALEGVDEVFASSAWKQIIVSFEPDKVTPDEMKKALSEAGYAGDEEQTPVLVMADAIKRDPQWEVVGSRVTRTNPADNKMSGEFRRY